MQISLFLYLLVTLTLTSVKADIYARKVDVRLPVHRPEEVEDKNPENVNVLLTTLFEMHHNLLAQISLLEDKLKTASLPMIEKSEITHMVEHYTAQKNNIELSIQQIQSNDGLDITKARSSDEEKDPSIETKSIPLIINFFKRAQNPTTEQTNANTAYSLAYQPSHFEPQPVVGPPTYVYQASPTVSVPAFQQQISQPNTQSPVYYQEQPNQPQQAQVVNYPQVQASQPEPQYLTQPQLQQQVDHQPQFATTLQVMPYSQVQATLPEQQYQVQPQLDQQLQSQSQLEQLPHFQIQSQLEQQPQVQVQPQLAQQQQISSQYQTQQQLQSQPQQQFDFESVFRPSRVPVRKPQVSEYDTQRQGPFGQKEGIFVYYPNGIITDDKDRPSIANRFNQAFDRFGQAISSLGNRQPSTIDTSAPRSKEALPVKNKVKGSLLKVSSLLKSKKPIDKKTSVSTPEGETEQDKVMTSTQ